MENLLLLNDSEFQLRINRIKSHLNANNIEAALISDNANKYYVSGRVFNGFAYIPADGDVLFFIRRPVELSGKNVVYIRKPENISETIINQGLVIPQNIGLELDLMPYSMVTRISKVFSNSQLVNVSSIIRQCRAVKTEHEISLLEQSGIKHQYVYSNIPSLYNEGMTDVELQIEIERISRLNGCLGQFRISGDSMELYMGNLICGDNADAPSPYDFAMGGAGINPSLPVGSDGTIIKSGMTIMVDMNGNYTGYMTDMTRVFSLGNIDSLAQKAHNCSIEINQTLAKMGRPGVEAKALYEKAIEIVQNYGLENLFMGHRQKAGFIGHGVGIEVNELPVIAPRSSDVLEVGNAIALEPKFVIPGIGAVGVENTYIVTPSGMKCITNAPEEIISLD